MREPEAEKKRGEETSPNLRREVFRKENRKIRGRREKDRGVWYGLGMFGLVGWAVAIPTLLGLGVGIWIDSRWPGRHSWTLMGLVIGVVLGCLNAWFWVKQEIHRD
jgi:ATP synthase protein I